MNDFHGYPVRTLSSNSIELDYLATAGPRIVGMRYKGSDNLLAEVPEIAIPTPYGDYHYFGGHRLWYAPEAMPRAYIPDNEGLEVEELPNGIILKGRVEPGSGIRKHIEIHMDPSQRRVTLTHTLTNEGLWEVELAPWALTMCRLGGTAILPTRAANDPVENKLLPNRHISLWPYSRVHDARLTIEDEFIAVWAKTNLPPFKIGTFNSKGWVAYWRDEALFRKSFPVRVGLAYPDYGCNAEIYCDSRFIELESVAAFARLAPAASETHQETWEFYDSLEQEFLTPRMIELCKQGVEAGSAG